MVNDAIKLTGKASQSKGATEFSRDSRTSNQVDWLPVGMNCSKVGGGSSVTTDRKDVGSNRGPGTRSLTLNGIKKFRSM